MVRDPRFTRRSALGGILALASGPLLPGASRAQSSAAMQQQAMDAAEELSVLEATAHLPALYQFYDRMHPDAKPIIPRNVVIGWYQDNWIPKGPHPAVATGVQVVYWTWGVTGVTYPDTYEVSFTQTFDNAPTRNDVVRLVYVEPYFRWFFGRNREFVEKQIAYYHDQAYIPQAGQVPYDLQHVTGAEPDVVYLLPIRIGDALGEIVSDARQIPGYAAFMPPGVLYRSGEYPIGFARATTLQTGASMTGTIEHVVQDAVESPPFRLIAWNLHPANGVPFARYEHFASEAVGNAQTIIWGDTGGSVLWELSFVAEDDLETLAHALVAIAGIT